MKTIKTFLAASMLLCAISSSIYAGDIGTPGYTTCGDIGTPGVVTHVSSTSDTSISDNSVATTDLTSTGSLSTSDELLMAWLTIMPGF